MSRFLTTLHVELLDDSERARWIVTDPLLFESLVLGRVVTVPAGFETDFASVPRLPLLYALFGDTVHAPAVVHDWLYTTAGTCRAQADAAFLEAMRASGAPRWRSRLMYLAVRIGGAAHFRRREAAQSEAA